MIVKLAYGRETVAADLRGLRVRPLEPTAPRASTSPRQLVATALAEPLASPVLEELARSRSTAVVVVPDATRKCCLKDLLPLLLEKLAEAAVPPSQTTVLVACGTHPPTSSGALAELVGPLPAGVRLVQHASRDESQLVEVGRLADGTPVRLNRLVVEAKLVVTVAGVQHHYFAGFGGGPKMIFPGVAGYDEIQVNHARVLDLDGDEPRRNPACEPGILAGNPVAEEIAAVTAFRPPDFAVCLVPGRDGEPAWAAAGAPQACFDAAVARARQWHEVPLRRVGLMVACGGGAPSDQTLIQAHKALDAACRFVEDDGEVLFAAELSGGPGSPEMEPFLADPRPAAVIERLRRQWIQYGHTTLRIVEKTARVRVHLVSRLAPELCRRLGFHPAADPDSVLDRWREERPGATVGVVAGPPVFPARP